MEKLTLFLKRIWGLYIDAISADKKLFSITVTRTFWWTGSKKNEVNYEDRRDVEDTTK